MVTREELSLEIWKSADPNSLESLRTTLKELRLALGDAQGCIQNIRGQGYRFIPFGAPPGLASPTTAV